jgi:AraC-like DNA-binding protein
MRQRYISSVQLQVHAILEDFRLEHRLKNNNLPRAVRDVLDCINEALFDSRLNVRFLKVHCRIRDNNISSRFRYVTGVTIKDYIEGLRLEAAELLLRERAISIFDVAASVGYYHPQTFYRAFQRKYGCTPAAYREKHGPALQGSEVAGSVACPDKMRG